MPWGKMDDKFHRNPKVRALRRTKAGREALGVWVYWWSWCLDDPSLTGFVSSEELPGVDEKPAELLVEVGLWDKVDGGYSFHDFKKYNPTRAKLDAKRTVDRTRVAADREMEKFATEHSVSQATNDNVARDNASDSHQESPATNPDVASLRARWDGSSGSSSDSESSGELSEAHRALMRGYVLRYEKAKQTPWSSYAANYSSIVSVAHWVEQAATAHKLKITQVTAVTLDEFFEDAFAASTDFSWGLLAKSPGKYYSRHRGVQSHIATKTQREAS